MRVLVLGGTTEASALTGLLAARDDIDSMVSLAGRTAAPVRPPVPYRIGGFGGVQGLATFLRDHRITCFCKIGIANCAYRCISSSRLSTFI
jgi:precorrin-6A/cobalt-precorrin-6A reductase